jgi:hypothetical protein
MQSFGDACLAGAWGKFHPYPPTVGGTLLQSVLLSLLSIYSRQR